MNKFLLTVPQDWLITFLASVLIWLMFGGVLVLALKGGKTQRQQALRAFLAVLIAWVIIEMLKSLLPSVRPFRTIGYTPLTLTIPGNNSFPSSHAALAFALAISIWLENKKQGWFFIAAAIAVSLGRLLAGVHYLLDIIVGAWVGTVVASVISKLALVKRK